MARLRVLARAVRVNARVLLLERVRARVRHDVFDPNERRADKPRTLFTA
jgi:hypothetical protein